MTCLVPFYSGNKENLTFCHININSVRHKFEPLAEAFTKGAIDVSSVQQSKLDDSFPPGQFQVEGFKTYRKEVTGKCGGLMMVVRGDIPQWRRPDLEVELPAIKGRMEIMILELTVKGRKVDVLQCLQAALG